MRSPLARSQIAIFVVVLSNVSALGAGCASTEVDGTGDPGASAELDGVFPNTRTGHAAARLYWARYVKNKIAPELIDLGVSSYLIRRVAWFAVEEGIFTIGTNPEYGEPDGHQSPLGMSNCGDSVRVNSRTAFPDCFGKEGFAFRSGNWQVGIGGAQVSDSLEMLPRLYRQLYGDTAPSQIAQPILASIGETVRFPALSIEEVSTRANVRWASVVLRDPWLNVYTQTFNTWITDGRDLGYGGSLIAQVWAE